VVTFPDALEKCISSIIIGTALLQVDVKVVQNKKFVGDCGWLEAFSLSRVWKTRGWDWFVCS